MLSPAVAHGRFVWFELLTTDPAAAMDFYTGVVGWTIEPFGDGAQAYQMWKTPGGHTIGGVMTLPEEAKAMGAPPHWMGNLAVVDIDAAVATVRSAGGMVYNGPFDVPNIGRVAIVADPQGASLALYQPAGDAPGHTEQPQVGEVSWNELMTSDVGAAMDFYAQLAGWQKTDAMDMGPMGTYQMFGPQSGGTIGGAMTRPPQIPMSYWGYYFYVADLDASIATALANGARVLNGPMPIPGGDRVVNMMDPQGAAFSLHGK